MHPAYSVILFTTASGAGYGLLIWLSLAIVLAQLPADGRLGLIAMGLSLGLISLGLLSSTFHLGRPERAWRAMSQWRTSWLSREGVLALATFLPAGLLGIGWVFLERLDGPFRVLALLAAVLALATVWSTGMIYASLKTIRAWHQPLVAPVYVVLALATGAVIMTALLAAFGLSYRLHAVVAIAGLGVASWLKSAYWKAIDTAKKTHTVGAATGLGHLGMVRQLEPAHSQPNFVMREMGYTVARKHAEKLREYVLRFGFLIPAGALGLSLFLSGPAHLVVLATATLCAAIGVAVERWLFFAEAQHVVTLYYGAEAA